VRNYFHKTRKVERMRSDSGSLFPFQEKFAIGIENDELQVGFSVGSPL
jgi:hypothetical protein